MLKRIQTLFILINSRNLMWFWFKMVFAAMLARSYVIDKFYWYMHKVSPGLFSEEQFYALSDGLASFAVFAAVKAAYSQRAIKTKMVIDFLLAAIAADVVSRLFGITTVEREDALIPLLVIANFAVYYKQRRVVRLVLYKSYKVVSLYYSDFKHMIKG